MRLDCKYISVSEAEDEIFQILLKANGDEEDGPYLLLQRAFLEEDEGENAPCYVETHDDRSIGHYPEVELELTRDQLTVRLPPPVGQTIEANFRLTDEEEFKQISEILKVIVQ